MPKKLQKSRKTMGKLWDKCIKMLVSPGKMLVSPIFFVFNGEFFWFRGLEMGGCWDFFHRKEGSLP